MIDRLGNMIVIINRIMFGLGIILSIGGIICEIIGPAYFEKILKKLNESWTYDGYWNICYVVLAVIIITYIIRKNV